MLPSHTVVQNKYLIGYFINSGSLANQGQPYISQCTVEISNIVLQKTRQVNLKVIPTYFLMLTSNSILICILFSNDNLGTCHLFPLLWNSYEADPKRIPLTFFINQILCLTFLPTLLVSPLIPHTAAVNNSLLASIHVEMAVFRLRKMSFAFCCGASPVPWDSQGSPFHTHEQPEVGGS